jgi:hypothetical protein
MLRERSGEHLDDWLAKVNRSRLPELQSFAKGVEKNKDAVRAGLTWWGSQRHGGRPPDQAQTHQKARLRPGRFPLVRQIRFP